MSNTREYTILHLFGGAGGGGLGSAEARTELGGTRARFRVLGGVDIDRQACADFESLVGAPALCADVAALQPAELRHAFGARAPDVVLTSPPCKGFSALLAKAKAATAKYQRLNRLVLQGVHLVLSAWTEGPRVIFLENVPRITSRGKHLLVQVRQLLAAHGYVWAEGNHDCGEVGGLGQHRRRYFLVARHRARMGQVVYVPPRRRVRACGEVLGALPVPGIEGDCGGPMHRLPNLSLRNLVRLAAIPPGGDWRDLHKVLESDTAAPTIGGAGSNGAAAVAGPRGFPGHLGVLDPAQPAGTVTAGAAVARGAFAVADDRLALGKTAEGSGRYNGSPGLLGLPSWGQPARTVTGNPRALSCRPRSGAYGVLHWHEAAALVSGHLRVDNGRAAIADPRLSAALDLVPERVKSAPRGPLVIIAPDGTWHRPLTTLELAALQGFPTTVAGAPLVLAGKSHTRWRQAIGDAIPPPAARAVCEQLLEALLASDTETFRMRPQEIWAQQARPRDPASRRGPQHRQGAVIA